MFPKVLLALAKSSLRLRPKSELEALFILLFFVARKWRER